MGCIFEVWPAPGAREAPHIFDRQTSKTQPRKIRPDCLKVPSPIGTYRRQQGANRVPRPGTLLAKPAAKGSKAAVSAAARRPWLVTRPTQGFPGMPKYAPAVDVAKPYKFIGVGAMDVTKPYKFMGVGAVDVTKSL